MGRCLCTEDHIVQEQASTEKCFFVPKIVLAKTPACCHQDGNSELPFARLCAGDKGSWHSLPPPPRSSRVGFCATSQTCRSKRKGPKNNRVQIITRSKSCCSTGLAAYGSAYGRGFTAARIPWKDPSSLCW